MIVDLTDLKYIDIDGIDCLKFLSKLDKTMRIGFTKMQGNVIFDKSDFVNNSSFFENLTEATEMTKQNGPHPMMEGGE